MPRHNPPFQQAFTYFSQDARRYIRQNRPRWSTTNINITIDTIWHGNQALRTYYGAHAANNVTRRNLAGLPTPNPIPDRPFTRANLTAARTHGQLPAAAPPAATAPAAIAPAVVGAAGIAPAPAPAQQSGNNYPFDFWPSQWDPDPDTEGWPTLDEITSEREARKAFLALPLARWQESASPWTWRGARFLGSGSFGSAGLWVRVDDYGNIRDRLVVKDCQPARSEWRNPIYWRDKLPREISLHRRIDRRRALLDPAPGFENIVQHRGYRLMMSKRRYRLYLKYYAGGDLYRAMGQHVSFWTAVPGMERNHVLGITRRIPEHFIWHVFASLVRACRILRTGTLDTTPIPHWKPITHLDISPSNIFLLEHGRATHRPTIVLSDLGMSFSELEHDAAGPSDNPIEYTTDTYETRHPPEQQRVRGNPPVPLDEKTDIFRIGSTIWELVAHSWSDLGPMVENAALKDRLGNPIHAVNALQPVSGTDRGLLTESAVFPMPSRAYPAANAYSPELKRLVRRCLEWRAEERVGLAELEGAIQLFLEANPDVRTDVQMPLFTEKKERFELGAEFESGVGLRRRR